MSKSWLYLLPLLGSVQLAQAEGFAMLSDHIKLIGGTITMIGDVERFQGSGIGTSDMYKFGKDCLKLVDFGSGGYWGSSNERRPGILVQERNSDSFKLAILSNDGSGLKAEVKRVSLINCPNTAVAEPLKRDPAQERRLKKYYEDKAGMRKLQDQLDRDGFK
jgi:hypothetical protein